LSLASTSGFVDIEGGLGRLAALNAMTIQSTGRDVHFGAATTLAVNSGTAGIQLTSKLGAVSVQATGNSNSNIEIGSSGTTTLTAPTINIATTSLTAKSIGSVVVTGSTTLTSVSEVRTTNQPTRPTNKTNQQDQQDQPTRPINQSINQSIHRQTNKQVQLSHFVLVVVCD
jgi:hypothetical protein